MSKKFELTITRHQTLTKTIEAEDLKAAEKEGLRIADAGAGATTGFEVVNDDCELEDVTDMDPEPEEAEEAESDD